MYYCTKGHELKVINGTCADCNRDRQARHREVNRSARALYRGLTDRGIPLDIDRLATGHKLLTVVDVMRDPTIP